MSKIGTFKSKKNVKQIMINLVVARVFVNVQSAPFRVISGRWFGQDALFI